MATGEAARKAAESTKDSVGSVGPVGKAASTTTSATARAAKKAKESTAKSVRKAKVTRAARAGKVEDARQMAEDADLGEGKAAEAIQEAEALHYQVEVNKRALSVNALTKTLNDRWDNGWRLAHVLEQRGNTVLVFEKRS